MNSEVGPSRFPLGEDDYVRLLGFRDGLRRFLHWSEREAKGVGLTAAQHQLLLAIRGHGGPPSIGDIAEHLMLRHHSVVQLVDRAARAGLVARSVDEQDHRVVRLHLSDEGQGKLDALSQAHLEELSRLRQTFRALWEQLPPA